MIYYPGRTTVYQQDVYVNNAPPADISYSGGYANVLPPAPVVVEGQAPAALPAPNGDIANPPELTDRAKELMEQGLTAFSERSYESAARTFLQVAMDDPQNVDALLAYAVSRFATGDYAVAAIAIRRGINKFPMIVDAAFDVRSRYGELDDYTDHLLALETYVQEQPNEVDGWLVLGFIRHFSDNRELAKRTFEAVQQMSERYDDIAELFLNAKPLPEPVGPDPQTAPATQPADAAPVDDGSTAVLELEREALESTTGESDLKAAGLTQPKPLPGAMQEVVVPDEPAE